MSSGYLPVVGEIEEPVKIESSSQEPVEIVVTDGQGVDAFAAQRVSQPYTLFESLMVTDEQPLLWDTITSGGGVSNYVQQKSAVEMVVGTASGDKVIRQSKVRGIYQPRKSLSVTLTGIMGAIKTNVRQRIGYFDEEDGVFFEQNGSELRFVLRSSVSGTPQDTVVSQANWNKDTLDGNGKSEVTLDNSKTQIFGIDLQWLGVGRVRAGFNVGGIPIDAHHILNANVKTEVYMRSPNLPARYEIENIGNTASSTTMTQICCAIISEGGFEDLGYQFSVDTGLDDVDISSERALVAIRPKLTFNGIVNRTPALPIALDFFPTEHQVIRWRLCYNPTFGGTPTWTSADDDSTVEYLTNYTNITDNGKVVASGFIGEKAKISLSGMRFKLPLVTTHDGSDSSVYAFIVENVGAAVKSHGGMTWKEMR